MKFFYEYRTRDNERRSGEVNAADREAAFALLKSQGIRPSRLNEAPGLANKLLGKGKRWIAIVVLSALVVTLCCVHGWREGGAGAQNSVESAFDAMSRRQVIGDSVVIELGIRNGWANVFTEEGERFLASFAVPGVPAGVRTTRVEEIEAALGRHIIATAEDGIEARQIKAMVEGMKRELRDYLADGGTIRLYGEALVDRQEQELRHYNMVKRELEMAEKSGAGETDVLALWERRNAELRRMGIRLVPLAEEK